MSNSYRFRQWAFGLLVALFAISLGSASASAQTQNFKRKVVFEDFTGTWCQYCPYGSWALDSMEKANRMGDNIVVFGWHIDDDMQFPGSVKMAQDFGISSFPTGIMSRRFSYGNTQWSEAHPWYTASRQEALRAPTVDIRITNVKVVGTKIDFDVEVTPLDLATMPKEDTSKYALFVGVTEDAVVRDQQFINGQMLMDFVHNNVARYIATATQGDNFPMGTTTTVNTYPIKKHFSFNSINGEWVLNNLRIKAFVTNASSKTKFQYIQNADQTHRLGDLPETAPNAIWTVTPAEDAEIPSTKPASIVWSKQGTVSTAKLEYSIDGGIKWNEIATGITASPYSWTLPESVWGQQVILRISDPGDQQVMSTSEPFSVVAPVNPEIYVLSPAVGEEVRINRDYEITFATQGEMDQSWKVELTTDGGTEWTNIKTTTTKSATWKVPSTPVAEAQLRITSTDGIIGMSGVFSIAPAGTVSDLTVNNGNYPLETGKTYTVKWAASGEPGKYTLQSSQDGQLWVDVVTNLNASLRQYNWVAPATPVATAYLKLKSIDAGEATVGPFAIEQGTTGAVRQNGTPTSTMIAGNYPNPVTTTSKIDYHIAAAGDVMLTVRDIMGKDVVTLENGFHSIGVYTTNLDAANLAPGTYVVTLLVNGETHSRTISVTR